MLSTFLEVLEPPTSKLSQPEYSQSMTACFLSYPKIVF